MGLRHWRCARRGRFGILWVQDVLAEDRHPKITIMFRIQQRTFEDFAGRGVRHPSDSMRVSDGEALLLLEGLADTRWGTPVWIGRHRHAGYSIRHAPEFVTGLFAEGDLAGFYAGSYLWLDRRHRGRGLSVPLILAAAENRGGTVLPPGVVVQGYTAAGLAAHRSAYERSLQAAGTLDLRGRSGERYPTIAPHSPDIAFA